MRTFYDKSELDTSDDKQYTEGNLGFESELDEQIEMFEEKKRVEEKEESYFDGYSHSILTSLEGNCKSEMHINPENKIIYVRPRGAQYFLATSSKCNGSINVRYIGYEFNPKSKKICGNLGTYFILSSGILFVPNEKIKPRDIDILSFEAFDACNKFKFDVVFTFDPCKCF